MEHTFNLRQISKKKKRKKKEKKNRKKGRKEGRKEGRKRERKRKKGIFQKKKKKKSVRAVVAHAFNRSIREAEADRLMCSRPAWSTQ